MDINYKGLWKMLTDRNMSKSDPRSTTGITASTFLRMYKNKYMSLDVLVRICQALNCQLNDIVEVEIHLNSGQKLKKID